MFDCCCGVPKPLDRVFLPQDDGVAFESIWNEWADLKEWKNRKVKEMVWKNEGWIVKYIGLKLKGKKKKKIGIKKLAVSTALFSKKLFFLYN